MSSETSTENAELRRGRLQPALGPPEGGPYVAINETARAGDAFPPRRSVRDGDPGFEPWQLFTLAGLIGATVVVFVSRGQTPAGIILLSLTIFTAAIVGVAMWRTLAPFTGSDERTGPVVVGGRTR